jgi:hypothetical protein
LQVEVFQSQSTVAFYVVAVLALAAHLYFGWEKAVAKMSDVRSAALLAPVTLLGRWLLVPVTGGFIACVLAAHVQSSLQ